MNKLVAVAWRSPQEHVHPALDRPLVKSRYSGGVLVGYGLLVVALFRRGGGRLATPSKVKL